MEKKPTLDRSDPPVAADENCRTIPQNAAMHIRSSSVEHSSGLLAGNAGLLEKEKRVFERIAIGGDLLLVLDEVAQLWEENAGNYQRCAIFLANDVGDRLWVASAPSMQPLFYELAKDTVISPDSDPLGVAAWSKKPVLVEDFHTDPHWEVMTEISASNGVCSEWAHPVISSSGRLLGTVAVYSSDPGRPSIMEAALMERLVHLIRIAIEKYQAELAIERMSNYDSLTGLPNRALFLDRLDGAILRGIKNRRVTSILLISLGGMKQISDTLGYELGDRFLVALASRLRSQFSHGETVARVGGDEFGVVVEDLMEEELLTDTLQSLLIAITGPIIIDGHEVSTTACIGVSLSPKDGDDADTLYRQADTALHRARVHGYPSFQFFTADMNVKAALRIALITELRHALDRGEFRIQYQPQIDLMTGRVVGAEALLRWTHPRHGLVSPSEFIPLLEESGEIIRVGDWVFREICMSSIALRETHRRPIRLSMNLSPRQFLDTGMTSRMETLLEEYKINPGSLTIEITETLLMREPEKAVLVLNRLKELHVRIAVDDFGTGYSSLSYLKKFPIDDLKIDKSFVEGVPDSLADAAITSTVIQLAHSLGMKSVAEGVERNEQKAFLEKHGCDEMQGFLHSKPMDFEGFSAHLMLD